jgi:protein tyrosine/serine phosphatase
MTFRGKRRFWLAGGVVVVLLGVAGGALAYQAYRLPKRFAAVAEGHLYRSGEVSPGQLERLQREYGVRRVVSLLNAEAPVTVAERAAAERLGLEWCNVPLPGNGASTPADRERIRALLTDPHAAPTLVHCAAGVNRTGLAVGLYRLHQEHWPLERVLAELQSFGFEDDLKHENLRQALTEESQAAAGGVGSRQSERELSHSTDQAR